MANIVAKGIDVSKHQGTIDFAKVAKAGVDYVIIRAGYGKLLSQKDPKFETYYKDAKAAGLKVGAYWYSYAMTASEAKTEAEVCMKVLTGKTFEYPIYFDLEEKDAFAQGKDVCSAMVEAFCGALEKSGYYAGLYMSRSPLQNYITSDVAKKYSLWVAEYNSTCKYSGSYDMWQYSSTGKVDGIGGNVDMDYAYTNLAAAVAKAGKNGIKKSASTSSTTKIETKKTTAASAKSSSTPDVTYCVYTNGKWLPEVKNCNDTNTNGYAGIERQKVRGLCVKSSKGTIRYRVHLKSGGWLSYITKYNTKDWMHGVAGLKNQDIDAIQMELTGCPGYQVQYRVSQIGSTNYYPWVKGLADYAGVFGKTIDKIQIKIVKN